MSFETSIWCFYRNSRHCKLQSASNSIFQIKINSRTAGIPDQNANAVFLKGSSDPTHFSLEIDVENSRFRHTTTLNLNHAIFNRFWVDLEIQFQSRSMSDPTLSDFKNKMDWVWTTLNDVNDVGYKNGFICSQYLVMVANICPGSCDQDHVVKYLTRL